MAKCWNGKGNLAIMYHLKRMKATKADLGRLLNVGQDTIHNYINRPYLMRLEDLMLVAGYFGVPIEELIYCIARNKPKENKASKWYLESVRLNGDKAMDQGL